MTYEALREVFSEAECTVCRVEELSEQSCTLLQDVSEDYFGNAATEKRAMKVWMEWNRIGNLVRIIENLQGLIINQCNQLESVIEEALNCESKKEREEKNDAAE